MNNSKRAFQSVLVLTKYDSSLISYWPINSFSSNLTTDYIGGKTATSSSPTYQADRFGVASGAIRISSCSNYYSIPPGVYFSGDFTVMFWGYIVSSRVSDYTRFMEIENSIEYDNIIISDTNGII
jgi:hypothetical protein